MKLIFQPDRIPRSTGRHEWISIWRQKRVITKQLAESEVVRLRVARDIYPNERYARVMDEIINPPIMVFP